MTIPTSFESLCDIKLASALKGALRSDETECCYKPFPYPEVNGIDSLRLHIIFWGVGSNWFSSPAILDCSTLTFFI